LALISSTTICPAHVTPSPVIADGPLIAEANPTRIGGPPCAHAGATANTVNSSAITVLMSVSVDPANSQSVRQRQIAYGIQHGHDSECDAGLLSSEARFKKPLQVSGLNAGTQCRQPSRLSMRA